MNQHQQYVPESDVLADRTPVRFCLGLCSLGSILVAQNPRGVCAIFLGDEPDMLTRRLYEAFPEASLAGDDPDLARTMSQVIDFVEDPGRELALPVDMQGTPFQKQVWQALRDIPSGITVSYAELAQRIGSPRAVRAVARACGANLVAVAIPCHRVVRSDGGLSGYRWGVQRKRQLLERESAHAPALV